MGQFPTLSGWLCGTRSVRSHRHRFLMLTPGPSVDSRQAPAARRRPPFPLEWWFLNDHDFQEAQTSKSKPTTSLYNIAVCLVISISFASSTHVSKDESDFQKHSLFMKSGSRNFLLAVPLPFPSLSYSKYRQGDCSPTQSVELNVSSKQDRRGHVGNEWMCLIVLNPFTLHIKVKTHNSAEVDWRSDDVCV